MAQYKCCTACHDAELDALIYQTKATLARLSDEIVKMRSFGFSCDKKAEPRSDLLGRYLNVLEDENRKIALGGKPCLDCYKKQSLAEKVRLLTYSCKLGLRKDLIVDESGADAWAINNPFCISRERWEKIATTVCAAFNLEININGVQDIDTMCNLTFELVRQSVSCDILVAISVYQEMCDLKFSISRSEEECKIDFEILTEELDCDLDFEMYKYLIECDLSFDIIKTVYENGCTFVVGDPVSLVTPLGVIIPMQDFTIKGKPDIQTLKNLGVNLDNSKFIKNPNKFINKLKNDYRGK